MSAAPTTPDEWIRRYMPWRLRDPRYRDRQRLPGERRRIRYMLGSVVPKMRAEVIARDGYRCRYCLRSVARDRAPRPLGEALPPDRLTMDHVVPRSLGGTNSIDNLVVSCHGCNQFRECLLYRRLPLPPPIPLEYVQMVAA